MSDADLWTYVLITPDGMVSGAFDTIVDLVLRKGLDIVASRTHRLEVPTMVEVYRKPPRPDSAAKPKSGGIQIPARMYENVYNAGPACLLLLYRAGGNACAVMSRCKGYTRPEVAEPGTVRHGGENVILNLVHCPDDADNAWRELVILVGADDAKRLRAMALAGPAGNTGLLGVATLRDSLPALHGWEAISFPETANRIRRRIVSSLALASWEDPESTSLLIAAQASLDEERDLVAARSTSLKRMLLAQQTNASIHENLTAVAAKLGLQALLTGLDALAALYDLDGDRDVAPVLALADHGVFVSALEKMVLDSHAVSFRPHEDLAAVYRATVGQSR